MLHIFALCTASSYEGSPPVFFGPVLSEVRRDTLTFAALVLFRPPRHSPRERERRAREESP